MAEAKNKGGRPRATNPKNINLKFRLDEAMNNRLLDYCERYHLPKTTAVRLALTMLFDADDEKR